MIVFPAKKQEKLKTRVTWCVAYLYCRYSYAYMFYYFAKHSSYSWKTKFVKRAN